MKDLLDFILNSLIGDNYEIETREVDGRIEFIVMVDNQMIARVIGKDGNTIKMIRNLIKVPAILSKKNFYLNVVEK